jgi:hypothetical protein
MDKYYLKLAISRLADAHRAMVDAFSYLLQAGGNKKALLALRKIHITALEESINSLQEAIEPDDNMNFEDNQP